MKKAQQILALLLTAVLLGNLAGCSSRSSVRKIQENNQKTKVIRVGFVYPKRGTYKSFGEYSEEWTNYAVSQINEAGLTIDGQPAIISLITADSNSEAAGAKRAAEDLIDDKGVDLMITSKTADTTVPVSKVCERKGVVCLSVDTPTDTWAVTRHRYSYHAGFSTEGELESFRNAWDQASTNKRVGVLHANDPEGSTIIRYMPRFAEKNGYVAYDPGAYQNGQTDFSNIIRNLRTQKIEILAGAMSTGDFRTFYLQLKKEGYLPKIRLMTVAKAALFSQDIEQLGVENLCTEVWWTPQFPYHSSINQMSCKELGREFTRVTGQKQVPPTAGYDYANVELLYAVLKQAGSLNTDKLRKAAESLNLDTVIGKVSYDSDHCSVQPLATGQWVYDRVNKTWEQKIISSGTIKGLQTDADLAS